MSEREGESDSGSIREGGMGSRERDGRERGVRLLHARILHFIAA